MTALIKDLTNGKFQGLMTAVNYFEGQHKKSLDGVIDRLHGICEENKGSLCFLFPMFDPKLISFEIVRDGVLITNGELAFNPEEGFYIKNGGNE
jgi:hypothetical protein